MGVCSCYHSCCGNDKSNEVYTPRRERWCTDVLCLVLLLLAWGGTGTLGFMCVVVKPQLLWKLYYPTDSYDQFCGRPGSATENLPFAFYADLDADIQERKRPCPNPPLGRLACAPRAHRVRTACAWCIACTALHRRTGWTWRRAGTLPFSKRSPRSALG